MVYASYLQSLGSPEPMLIKAWSVPLIMLQCEPKITVSRTAWGGVHTGWDVASQAKKKTEYIFCCKQIGTAVIKLLEFICIWFVNSFIFRRTAARCSVVAPWCNSFNIIRAWQRKFRCCGLRQETTWRLTLVGYPPLLLLFIVWLFFYSCWSTLNRLRRDHGYKIYEFSVTLATTLFKRHIDVRFLLYYLLA